VASLQYWQWSSYIGLDGLEFPLLKISIGNLIDPGRASRILDALNIAADTAYALRIRAAYYAHRPVPVYSHGSNRVWTLLVMKPPGRAEITCKQCEFDLIASAPI
jgi:hypothetical protein